MIITSELSVAYDKSIVVREVNLEARPGELTAIIGPNGSGKTSLMRALSGEIKYVGTATLNGMDVAGITPSILATHRGVLPQFSAVAFPFTVGEIVRLGQMAGLKSRQGVNMDMEITDALKRVDLEEYSERKYHELSGGEQQRVQFARVLCQVGEPVFEGTPRWLFLDEPISSLDIQHQLTIMNISRKFASHGGGVICILHDLNLAAMYADQIVLMHQGRVDRYGTPKKVLTNKALSETFGCPLKLGRTPPKGQPFVLPQSVEL